MPSASGRGQCPPIIHLPTNHVCDAVLSSSARCCRRSPSHSVSRSRFRSGADISWRYLGTLDIWTRYTATMFAAATPVESSEGERTIPPRATRRRSSDLQIAPLRNSLGTYSSLLGRVRTRLVPNAYGLCVSLVVWGRWYRPPLGWMLRGPRPRANGPCALRSMQAGDSLLVVWAGHHQSHRRPCRARRAGKAFLCDQLHNDGRRMPGEGAQSLSLSVAGWSVP